MTHERRASSAAGNSWRKWEPSSWEVEWRRRQAHERRVRILTVAYIVFGGLVTLLAVARSSL